MEVCSHTVRTHLRSHDSWVYWKRMVPGEIVLERDLHWLALLGDNNAAEVSLRHTSAQIRPRMIAPQGGGIRGRGAIDPYID